LAKTLISEANFLMMDEPTNHLDFLSVNILIQALQQYEGTFLIVSHDRHFVSQIATKIWYIEDEVIKEYPGSYDEYVYWQEKKDAAVKPKVEEPNIIKSKPSQTQRPQRDPNLQELKKLQTQLETVEQQIEKLETSRKKIEAEMTSPGVFGDFNKLQEKQIEYDKLSGKLDKSQSQWEQIAEMIDAMER
jgi:ATP-binding cassette subfamily F protein 3